eukprot:CAMPEP_0173275480 /NCGR_PEP_ID=MMETSP1143-20121109/3003_1 /TAXON_ID=483371 /ORGANISM="non described non described, Strain CCMP2298" /LENGTH=72 /DNA_ID=CAMNT_0014212375 /DNA_START=725 /DNA_END=943 /DNA_ORIENTATION=+
MRALASPALFSPEYQLVYDEPHPEGHTTVPEDLSNPSQVARWLTELIQVFWVASSTQSVVAPWAAQVEAQAL